MGQGEREARRTRRTRREEDEGRNGRRMTGRRELSGCPALLPVTLERSQVCEPRVCRQ